MGRRLLSGKDTLIPCNNSAGSSWGTIQMRVVQNQHPVIRVVSLNQVSRLRYQWLQLPPFPNDRWFGSRRLIYNQVLVYFPEGR
ncbi:MAG TPA: hypothetical protein EYO71_10150 [Rhodospirillales bacterium]|nr:hypothetical protein [Rhodospirillales bacterium]